MERIYNFAVESINASHTVLIYRGWTARMKKHVTDVERLEMRGGVMYCDGVSCKGMTVCLKVEAWK